MRRESEFMQKKVEVGTREGWMAVIGMEMNGLSYCEYGTLLGELSREQIALDCHWLKELQCTTVRECRVRIRCSDNALLLL